MELPALIALVEVYRIRIILERFPADLILEELSVITVVPVPSHRFLPRVIIMGKVH